MIKSYIRRIKLRILDIGTIKELCLGAEKYAHDSGEDTPGEEHFLLAAMALTDGTARKVFERISADPEEFSGAIKKQYSDALSSIGIDSSKIDIGSSDDEILAPKRVLYNSKPSAQSMMKKLVDMRRHDKEIPLLGAHVVDVIATSEQGVAARALRAMGISQETLRAAVKEEIKAYTFRA